MTVTLVVLFLIVLYLFLKTCTDFLILPTKCSKCQKILIKKYIKRIGILPYCKKCYNEILLENKKEIITNEINIIQKYSLTVRCLPHIVVHLWSYREGQKLKNNQKIVFIPKCNNKKFVREERKVERGGWWYVKETSNTGSTVRFNRKYDKFFAPTLKEAIQLFLVNKQK